MSRTRALPVFPVAPAPMRAGADPEVSRIVHPLEGVGPEGGPRVALVTLGCDKNTVDSERIMATLVGGGARVSSTIEGADVVIVNTCGFIQDAKEQSIEAILEACDLKAGGSARAVVAVGCLVQRYAEDLRAEIPEVDLFLGLSDLPELVPELRRRGLLPPPEEAPVSLMERPLRILSTDTPHTSYLKISEGCDHTCSFCAIPLMRGLHRSAPLDELVREAAALGRQGVREINIISQDTTWYGRDQRRQDRQAPLLPELLRALLDRTEIDWYRLFYMYPSGITPELVELIAREPRIVPYLDIPIQHGSDRMLERMRRPERQATIRDRVSRLRDAIPDLTLRTTVIVGFPGETEDDFGAMLDLLEELQFERVGAFAYSVEEGTRAAAMPDRVPEEVIAERLEELLERQRDLSFERNLAWVGRSCIALVDRVLPDEDEFTAVARTAAQALDVDGVTNLVGGDGLRPGEMVEVRIVEALDFDLIGEVVR